MSAAERDLNEHHEVADNYAANHNKAVLFGKLAKVMGNLKRLPKSGENTHFKYSYVTSDDVADAVRSALADAGVAFYANVIGYQREGKSTIAEMEFTFGCSETGATIPCRWFGEANDTQDKGLNKAYTSAEKYFLIKTFVIGTGDEVDADAESADVKPAQPKQVKMATEGVSLQDQLEKLRLMVNSRLPEEHHYNHIKHMYNALMERDDFNEWPGVLDKKQAGEYATILISRKMDAEEVAA